MWQNGEVRIEGLEGSEREGEVEREKTGREGGRTAGREGGGEQGEGLFGVWVSLL